MPTPAGYRTNPLWFAGAVLRAALRCPRRAGGHILRLAVTQVRFTCVHALPLLVVVGGLLVVPVLLRVAPLAADLGMGQTFDRLVMAVLVQEVGLLVPAILVVARSGTAVAGELATATVFGEKEALEALGVDPLHYYVLPRLLGFAVSVALLAVFFDTLILGGMALSHAREGDLSIFLALLRSAVTPADVWMTVLKGAVVGGGIAVISCKEGFDGPPDATNIPISVSRGTVRALVWVLGASALFAALRYLF